MAPFSPRATLVRYFRHNPIAVLLTLSYSLAYSSHK